jgi:hypothetical protein
MESLTTSILKGIWKNSTARMIQGMAQNSLLFKAILTLCILILQIEQVVVKIKII